MDIIKKGYLNKLQKPYRFECSECGRVVKAYEGEYDIKARCNEIYLLTCKYPT